MMTKIVIVGRFVPLIQYVLFFFYFGNDFFNTALFKNVFFITSMIFFH